MDWLHRDCLIGQVCRTGSSSGKGLICIMTSVQSPPPSSRLGRSQQREDALLVLGAVSWGKTVWPSQR